MKLNLGCGKEKMEGWVNVDISPTVKPDVACDLTKTPWQWLTTEYLSQPLEIIKYAPCPTLPNDKVVEIYSSHFLEHLDGDEQIRFMDECWRVLKPGGTLRIRCPYYTSIRAWQDPTHKRPISEATFHYYSKKEREAMGVSHYPIKADFDVKEVRLHFPEQMQHIPEDERKFLLQHAWNTAADIEVVLEKHDPNSETLDRQENAGLLQ